MPQPGQAYHGLVIIEKKVGEEKGEAEKKRWKKRVKKKRRNSVDIGSRSPKIQKEKKMTKSATSILAGVENTGFE